MIHKHRCIFHKKALSVVNPTRNVPHNNVFILIELPLFSSNVAIKTNGQDTSKAWILVHIEKPGTQFRCYHFIDMT